MLNRKLSLYPGNGHNNTHTFITENDYQPPLLIIHRLQPSFFYNIQEINIRPEHRPTYAPLNSGQGLVLMDLHVYVVTKYTG
jgi:hypothetical protein